MPSYKIDQLVMELSSAADLEKLLETHAMSAVAMVGLLKLAAGRGIGGARRKRLAKVHSQLVASRYSPLAVQRLCQLLMEETGELRLKSAVSVLAVAGIGKEVLKKDRGHLRVGAQSQERLAGDE